MPRNSAASWVVSWVSIGATETARPSAKFWAAYFKTRNNSSGSGMVSPVLDTNLARASGVSISR